MFHVISGFFKEQIDFYFVLKIDGKIESLYLYSGAAKALEELSADLKKILLSLEKQNKFSLYEESKLVMFHRLLIWASELWIRVPYGKQQDDEDEGKDDHLKEWTGLALKIDWRDYFVIVCRSSINIHFNFKTLM